MSYSKEEKVNHNIDILVKAYLLGLHIGYVEVKGDERYVEK